MLKLRSNLAAFFDGFEQQLAGRLFVVTLDDQLEIGE
jgi:hypothetical protein